MSTNILTITNTKKNDIEFDLEIEGLKESPSDVRFVIETSDMNLAFKCTQQKGKTCSVKIPPLAHLEKTLYPFHIEVVVDGYYFVPMKGQINIVGSFDVYTTEPKNKTIAPPKKEEKEEPKKVVKKEVKKEEPKKRTKESVSVVAGDLIRETSKRVTETKVELPETPKAEKEPFFKPVTFVEKKDPVVPSEKDVRVHDILSGIKK